MIVFVSQHHLLSLLPQCCHSGLGWVVVGGPFLLMLIMLVWPPAHLGRERLIWLFPWMQQPVSTLCTTSMLCRSISLLACPSERSLGNNGHLQCFWHLVHSCGRHLNGSPTSCPTHRILVLRLDVLPHDQTVGRICSTVPVVSFYCWRKIPKNSAVPLIWLPPVSGTKIGNIDDDPT